MQSVPHNAATPAQQAAAQELLRRQEALRAMWDFRRYIAPSAHPDFIYEPAAHHDVLIEALHFLEYGQTHEGKPVKRVLVMMPPGAAKSTYSSVQFAVWYAARNPGHNILACSNTTELAENFNRRRRNACFTKEWTTLAETKVDPNNQGVGRFMFESGGSMHAAGVGSSIVGLRADLLILDDPIQSFEQAMSQTQLDKIWAWYETDARSRLLPTGKELIVTTRWSRNDPAGRILDLIESGDESDWHVVRLPMLADSEDDPLGRELREPLWPEWFGKHQIDQNIKNPLRWSALYQQVPLDESGSWVPPHKIHLVNTDQISPDLNKVIAVDLALTVGKGDYTVFVIAAIDASRNLYILDVIRGQWSADYSVNVMYDLYKEHEPSAVIIDDDNASKVFTRLYYEIARHRGDSVYLKPLPLRGKDKETRAAAVRGMFMQGAVYIRNAHWTADLLREIHEFPSGDHDDQIDCLSLLGRYVPQMYAPKDSTAPVALLKDVFITDDNGKVWLNKELGQLFNENETGRGPVRLRRRI